MKIQLGNKDYELQGITINQYEKIKNHKDDILDDSEFISIMTGIDKDDIRQGTIQEIKFVSKVLNKYYENSLNDNPLRQLINYKGQMLGLTKPNDMTWGEWSDLEVLTSQKPLNLRQISSILYRPCETYNVSDLSSKIIKYDYEECMERSKDMGDFYIGDVMSSLFFFIKFARILIDKQKESMVLKMKKESSHQTKEPLKKS